MSSIRPDRQFISTRIGEVKASPTRKLERLSDDLPSALSDSCFDLLQGRGVKYDQWAACRNFRRETKATAQTTVGKARVVRTIVGKLPTEDLLVEPFGLLNVCGQKLYVVHTTVLFCLAHGFVSPGGGLAQ